MPTPMAWSIVKEDDGLNAGLHRVIVDDRPVVVWVLPDGRCIRLRVI